MRGNTIPSVCEYCDDSCDVCLHQPYEDTVAERYCTATSSDDEAAVTGYASSDVDSASDEEGSWFTTPRSQLVRQRVTYQHYEVDPNIGIELVPLQEDKEEEEEEEVHEQRAKEERYVRRVEVERAARAELAKGRRRRLRRQRPRRDDSPVAAPVALEMAEAALAAALASAKAEISDAGLDGTALAANYEAFAIFDDVPAPPANAQEARDVGGAAVPKDTNNNMWRATVRSYVSAVSVS